MRQEIHIAAFNRWQRMMCLSLHLNDEEQRRVTICMACCLQQLIKTRPAAQWFYLGKHTVLPSSFPLTVNRSPSTWRNQLVYVGGIAHPYGLSRAPLFGAGTSVCCTITIQKNIINGTSVGERDRWSRKRISTQGVLHICLNIEDVETPPNKKSSSKNQWSVAMSTLWSISTLLYPLGELHHLSWGIQHEE